jgi:hypothetical protein
MTKQLYEQIDRVLSNKTLLKNKWTPIIRNDYIFIYHYHHLIFIYDLKLKTSLYEGQNMILKPTDIRGINNCKLYFKNKY